MKAVATICLLALSVFCQAQNFAGKILDADTTRSDSLRVLKYARIAMEYRRTNPDSGFFFANKGLQLAKEIDVSSVKASAHNAIGNLHFFQSNYDSALHHYDKCYNLSLKLKDTLRLGSMLNNIGQVHIYMAEYDTAILLLFQAQEMYAVVDSSRLSSPTNNIGNAYYRMSDYDRALIYYKEAAVIKEKYNQRLSLSNTLNNIGIILKNQAKYDESIIYYEKSLAIAEEFNDKNKQANAHNNLASLYQDGLGDFIKSEYHVKKSIQIKEEMGDKAGLYNSYHNYADLLSKMGRSKEALDFIRKGEELEKQIGTNMYSADGLLRKSFVLSDLGRFEEAYNVYREAYVMKIDQINEDRNERIAEWEARFETVQKEAEIERLSLETELQKSELKNTKTIMALGSGGATAIVILLILIHRQRTKKLNAEKEAQDLQIEALEKRLIDLNISPTEIEVSANNLNDKINTPLTDREFEVLKLSMEGRTNSEIGDELFISNSTVKFHLRNTYSKLGVSNRKEALAYVSKTS